MENTETNLITIPYIGKRTKESLNSIGIHCVEDLRNCDPENLYLRDCKYKGFQEDRCQLYLFRMAVYYADHSERDLAKLNWWYWRDRTYPEEGSK